MITKNTIKIKSERVYCMSFINTVCKKLIAVLMSTVIIMGFLLPTAFADTESNIIKGGGFEDDFDFWSKYLWYDDVSSFEIDKEVFYSGTSSLRISSKSENDARIIQEISVSPLAYYTVTAYIKTKDVPESDSTHYRTGATISIINTMFVSSTVCGDTDWTKVEFSFRTAAGMESVELCFTLGGYGALNSGTAWFDDITVKQVSTAPANCHYLTSDTKQQESSRRTWNGHTLTERPDAVKWMAFAFIWFVVLAALAIAFAETGDICGSEKKLKKVFVFALTGAALFRVAVAMTAPGFPADIGLFKYWGWYASKDLFNMYSSTSGIGFLDYPPLYMYVLAPIGAAASGLSNVMGGALTQLLLKMPSLIADIVTSVLLYRLAKRYIDAKWAVVIGLLYAANPAIWMNSVGWGQVDSLFTMLIIFELMCITDKKWAGAGIFFALMVLLKPHGIIFTPAIGLVLLLEILRNKNWKPMLIAVSSGLLTCIVLILPFYIRMKFEDPTWIFKLYMGTIGNYEYATMNGFNFWAMLGYNVADVNKVWCGLKFSQWGMLGIIFAVVLAIVFALWGTKKDSKSREAMPAIVSCVLIVTVFTFASKMHERYMFSAIALSLVAFIQSRERWYLYLSMLFSIPSFANTYMIYNLQTTWNYCYPASGDIAVTLISLAEVMFFAVLLAVTIKVVILNRISKPGSVAELQKNK